MPFFIQSKGFLTACRDTAADCIIFLTVWNSWLRQQTSKIPSLYKVSLSFRWNDEGNFRRDDYFYLQHFSNMHYWPSVKSIRLDIWPNSFFCILLDFLEVLYFLLVGYAMRLRRLLRVLMHWSSLCSLLRTYEWSTCSKSSILFTETKSRQMKKERHRYPVILTEQAWSKKGLFILWTNYRGFDSQRFVSLLFSNLRVCRPPRHWFISFSRLRFPASFA